MNIRGMRTAIGAVVLVVGVVAACTPQPSGPAPTLPTDPLPPEIQTFEFVAPRSEAPVVATLRWRITDPNGDVLVCQFDFDGDGTHDRTVSPCPTSGDLLVLYDDEGTIVPALDVTDGSLDAPTTYVDPVLVTPGPSEQFDITFLFDPGMAPEYRAAFEAAADRWEDVIVDGWNPEPLVVPQGLLGWIPAYDGSVDDVLIAARAVWLDGPLGLLGQAGALGKRSSTGEPYFGLMEFDSADLEQFALDGGLEDLILHEMGHVLGIGLNWAAEGRIDDLLTNPTYNGPAANAAWHELGGTGQVPVEDSGGAGTWAAHWRETVFDTELMTGYSDGDEALSRVTVGALADRAYGVDLRGADQYQLPGTAPVAALRAGPAPHLHTTWVDPLPESLLKG